MPVQPQSPEPMRHSELRPGVGLAGLSLDFLRSQLCGLNESSPLTLTQQHGGDDGRNNRHEVPSAQPGTRRALLSAGPQEELYYSKVLPEQVPCAPAVKF